MKRPALALAALFVLATPSWCDVRVIDGDGMPIAGAHVSVIVAQSQPSALPAAQLSAVSDEKGHLPFDPPAVRHATVIVDHPAFAPVALGAEDRANRENLRLERGETWRGEVVTRADEAESLDGEICASGLLPSKDPAATYQWSRCSSVEHGSFEIAGLPGGPLEIDLQVAGFLPRVETVDPLTTTVLRVERGLLLDGFVTNARDLPIGGAIVTAGRARATSDKTGRFSLAVDRLPADVEVRKRGFRAWRDSIKRTGNLHVRLAPASTISGVLVTEDGGALLDAAIEIGRTRADGGQSTSWGPLEVSRTGEFVVDLDDAGRYDITVRATGFRQTRFSGLQVGNESALPLGLIPLKRGAGIRATVINSADGKIAPGALIEMVPAGALLLPRVRQHSVPGFVSGEDGQVTAAGFEIGRYLVTIRRADSAAVHRLVDLERDEIVDLGTIALDAGVEIRGRVADSDGEAVRNVPVRLFDPAREMLTPLATTMTGDGEFKFSRVSPGRYRIEVGGERLLVSQEVALRGNEPLVFVALQTTGITLHGHVTRGGIPVPQGSVRLVSELDPARRRGKIVMRRGGDSVGWGLAQSSVSRSVDDQGAFVLQGAPAGLVRLWYLGTAGESVLRSIVLTDAPEQSVNLELDGNRLEGRLIDGSTGTAMSGSVRLRDAEGRVLTDVSAAADGTFRIENLERAAYTIDARAAGYLPSAAKRVFVDKESAPLVFALERGAAGEIALTLMRTAKTPISSIPVTLFDEDGTLVRSLPTDDAGRRVFADVPPGEYILGWSDPLSGAGCSSRVLIDASHKPSLSVTLERGASVVLRCPIDRCASAQVGLLEIDSSDGLEMSPLLSGVTPAMRLSSDGEVSIGRLAPGRYRFKLWVADRQWEKDVTVGASDVSVVFQ